MSVPKKLLAILSLMLMTGSTWAAADGTEGSDDLFMYATSLVGTRYQSGGAIPASGLDCSGFVRHVFLQTLHTELPHSALEMSQKGEAVELADLRSGDLVFFNSPERPLSHVGIYLGEGRFIHASSSSTGNVMISNLQDPYWSKHFGGARRISPTLFMVSQP